MRKKKILIIGKSGFIGSSLAKWLKDKGYEVSSVSGRKKEWKSLDMKGIDTVVYAAGLAHTREKKKSEALFLNANVIHAQQSAFEAKQAGVHQYIYISSMNVYGSTGKRIGINTPLAPDRLYGRSKRQGELEILKLADETFKAVIIRPPVVSGAGCKGNIHFLVKASRYIKFFPNYPNQRSIIDIINLCEFISCVIDENADGIYHPQNKEDLSTYDLLSLMVRGTGRQIYAINFFNPIIAWMVPRISIVRKIFGDDCYERDLSDNNSFSYWIRSAEESVRDMLRDILK
jgi:UDP-glucose 4-epimerase